MLQLFFVVGVSILVCINTAHAEYVDKSIEFTVPGNPDVTPDIQFSTATAVNGHSYLVWLGADARPRVSQKFNGVFSTTFLEGSDYTAIEDPHNAFSMGIDPKGYIHIAGDMRYYPSEDHMAHMPARLRNHNSLQWVSNKPYDASGGFRFVGQKGSVSAFPGFSFNYPRFHNDRKGDLYFSSLCRAVWDPSGPKPGMMGVCFYKYNTDTQAWAAIGDVPPPSEVDSSAQSTFKVLFWEKGGSNGWFQGYKPSFKWDLQNRLHIALTSNVDPLVHGNSRLFYAMSPEGGLKADGSQASWRRADGSAVRSLPLRGKPENPSHADIVYDITDTSEEGLNDYVQVIVDRNGSPAVMVDHIWRRWNASAWTPDRSVPFYIEGQDSLLGNDGRLTFVNWEYLKRMETLDQASANYRLIDGDKNEKEFDSPSQLGLQSTGHVYGAVVKDDGAIDMVKVRITAGALPSGWASKAFGGLKSLGGSVDQTNGVWQLRSSGDGLVAAGDTTQFGYRTLDGDGTIVARIASRDSLADSSADGVMMRETLDPTSKAIFAAWKVGGSGILQTRANTGGSISEAGEASTATARWLKLTRAGDTFSAFRSEDGKQWIAMGSKTIAMNKTIYVGIAGQSQIGWRMHQAIFDNVTVTSSLPPTPTPNNGLRAKYFRGISLSGASILARDDASIDFAWGEGSPAKSVPADNFSARWTGYVQPQYSQVYTFCTTSDDGVRLFVTSKTLVDNWTPHAPIENCGTIALTAGKKYWIKLEYFEATGAATISLRWSSASQSKQIIPAARLFPVAG